MVGGGSTWRSRGLFADDPGVSSHDPGDGSATCPDPQSHSVSLLEGLGGGGRPRRGRPERGGGDLKYPTGVGGGPPGLVPRPSRWLENLSRPSVPLGNAASWFGGAVVVVGGGTLRARASASLAAKRFAVCGSASGSFLPNLRTKLLVPLVSRGGVLQTGPGNGSGGHLFQTR